MQKLKALIVGVSDYSAIQQNNLPFCVNDINLVTHSLILGLKVEKDNIVTLGNTGVVNKINFLNALSSIIANIEENDTFIFYFSGHGGNLVTDHYLLFSDGTLRTQDVIKILDKIPAKNKIVILDSCMSGNFKVNQTASISEEMNIAEFFGKGYAVISSSNATQYSYGHPYKPVSLFTSFLCEAITDKYLIKKGNKSLYDIQKLLFLYLEVWNKNNPNQQQTPIFRANMGGTILFPFEEYTTYEVKKIYCETDNYIIYSVEPMHRGIAKRYSVKVILKEPFLFKEMAEINHEIINKIIKVEIYQNKQMEARWIGKKANIIFCYFGRDEFDIINSNYICHTTWVDEMQDKGWWYRLYKNCEIIDEIHFNIHTYYSSLRIFEQENTGDEKSLIFQTKEIISQLISLGEKVISLYNEFLNNIMTEKDLVEAMKPIIPLLDKWYFAETELEIPPKEVKSWCQFCSNLAGTIHDFTLFYNTKYLSGRSPDNRRACMNITIKRYYEDLEKLKIEEQNIKLN